jgi:ELWxxDGT repeat protein
MVADINSGNPGSLPSHLIVSSGKLYFQADDGSNGTELWTYDGTNPPSMVADINSGKKGSFPAHLAVFNGKLYFRADDGVNGAELWEFYILRNDMFYSQAAYDGWVLETGENTNKGGLINTTNLTCLIGDDASDKQYRTILHFNTSRIPDDAVITKVTLQYKQHSIIGADPYATHGKVWADIKEGFFSNNPGLVKSDFAAAPSMGFAGYFVFTPSPLAYPIYRATLKDTAFQYLNLDGITQFRLRFGVDDDNDNTADYIKVFCGDMGVPFNRPVLRLWYYVP